jgi:hypothetical protein
MYGITTYGLGEFGSYYSIVTYGFGISVNYKLSLSFDLYIDQVVSIELER